MSEDWRERAACAGMDTELWFPVTAVTKTRHQLLEIRAAKDICHGCQVRMDCLLYALTTGERHGIWGGMTERERRSPKGRAIRAFALAAVPSAVSSLRT